MSNRFEIVESQAFEGTYGHVEILRDSETGVLYIYRRDGSSGGLTVLLDAEGKPVITK